MLDRTWLGSLLNGREDRKAPRRRADRRPSVEGLEGRQLMVASMGPIPNVSVPQSLGYQVAVDGTGANAPQTFTAKSDNPAVAVSVAQGQFWTIKVSHTAANASDVSFTDLPLTFQLFQDLTPTTAGKIASFINSGYYQGKTLHRIAANFSGQNDYVMQGGAPNPDGTGNSGLPGTPFGLELVQQLAYVNPGSLAMARGSSTNSNDSQFFFTTGTPTTLDFQYTIFGQVLNTPENQATIAQLEKVATQANSGLGNEKSLPINPVTITSSALASANSSGVVHVDATGAVAGTTANVTVTAFDPSTNTTASQVFKVNVTADSTPHPATFTFKPLAAPVTVSAQTGTATTVQLAGTTQNPNNTAVTIQYALASQPAHGTVSNFNAAKGTFTYTPAAGYTGTDTVSYTVTNVGGTPTPLVGNTTTVTFNVGPKVAVPVDTRAVRVIGNVLVVTPAATTKDATHEIVITQTNLPNSPANEKLVVSVDGQYDATQPLASSIDRIVVYGARGSDHVTVTDQVDSTIKVTLDGGQGGKNVLRAGAGSTREHGWYGLNDLYGGKGPNQLVGRAGRVRFHPTSTTGLVFAGTPKAHQALTGTYYKYTKGRLVETTPAAAQASELAAASVDTASPTVVRSLRAMPHVAASAASKARVPVASSVKKS